MILVKHFDIEECTCSSLTCFGSIYNIYKSEGKSEIEKKETCIRRENERRETNERRFISICESIIIMKSTKSLQKHNNSPGSTLRWKNVRLITAAVNFSLFQSLVLNNNFYIFNHAQIIGTMSNQFF